MRIAFILNRFRYVMDTRNAQTEEQPADREGPQKHRGRRERRGFTVSMISILLVVLVATMLVSMTLGQYGMKVSDIIGAIVHTFFGVELEGYQPVHETVIVSVRFPRIILRDRKASCRERV